MCAIERLKLLSIFILIILLSIQKNFEKETIEFYENCFFCKFLFGRSLPHRGKRLTRVDALALFCVSNTVLRSTVILYTILFSSFEDRKKELYMPIDSFLFYSLFFTLIVIFEL